MTNDPIVAEVRAIRDQLAAQCGYDMKELFRQLRKRQIDSRRKYVRYSARRIVPIEAFRATARDTESP